MSSAIQILTDLKNKKYFPVYFLHGEEPYYIDLIADYVANNILNETEKSFNQSLLYGKEIDVPSLISIARRYPMMSKFQVIVVKEAQHIKKIEDLLGYINQPSASTILVVCYKYKTIDNRTKFAKALSKKCVVLESKRLYDNKIPAWITEYVLSKGYRINNKAILIVHEYLGNDLSKITNELDKLIINIPKGSEITETIVYKHIGLNKDYNSFELNTSLGKKDYLKAYSIVKYFASNPNANPLVKTLGTLFYFFSKLYVYHTLNDKSNDSIQAALKISPFNIQEYKVASKNYTAKKTEEILSYLHEYDIKSKGIDNVSNSEGELLKELVYKILN